MHDALSLRREIADLLEFCWQNLSGQATLRAHAAIGMDEIEDSMLIFFFQAEDGIRDLYVTGVQTYALPILIGGIDASTIASIPLGVESIEEYRVGVNNPNATFGRASGGQIAAVSKSGTNQLHGSGYWFQDRKSVV